jgi:hypothetical protein
MRYRPGIDPARNQAEFSPLNHASRSCSIQSSVHDQATLMLLVFAKAITVIVAIYFLVLGVVALVRPAKARGFLLGFADTACKHYAELVARLLVGGSLLLVAEGSAYSTAIKPFGWILLISTAFMALVPWRLHGRFTQSAVPKALRLLPLMGTTSLLAGALLLWVVVAGAGA